LKQYPASGFPARLLYIKSLCTEEPAATTNLARLVRFGEAWLTHKAMRQSLR